MRAKVSDQGLLISRDLLGDVEEVEIRKEDHLIVVVPIPQDDPILELGKHPVSCGVPKASEQHDQMLY